MRLDSDFLGQKTKHTAHSTPPRTFFVAAWQSVFQAIGKLKNGRPTARQSVSQSDSRIQAARSYQKCVVVDHDHHQRRRRRRSSLVALVAVVVVAVTNQRCNDSVREFSSGRSQGPARASGGSDAAAAAAAVVIRLDGCSASDDDANINNAVDVDDLRDPPNFPPAGGTRVR